MVGAPGLCGQHIPHLGTLLPLVHGVIREAVAFEWRYRGGQDPSAVEAVAQLEPDDLTHAV